MSSTQNKTTGRKVASGVGRVFKTIGSLLLSIMMVGIVTGCIVGSVLTVYVLQEMGSQPTIDLDEVQLGYTSFIYVTDPVSGEDKELQRLYSSDNNRIWVSYDEISESTKQALVAIEDKRFWTHDGVDWYRTVGAFLSLFNVSDARGGGSTIHQQLVKNITQDDDYRIDRKVREIFRALNLGKRYTHERVLETYLNVASFGAGTNGIESAANTYFGKSAKDLTLAESAAIVGITSYPSKYNPFLNPEANKERQLHVLSEMYKQGMITEEEYEAAKIEPLNFVEYQEQTVTGEIQSYFVDYVIEEVLSDLMETRGISRTDAFKELYTGGYNVYITVDERIQSSMENYYSSNDNFPSISKERYPQSAATILDPYTGEVKGIVGGIGKKTGNLVFNRATMAQRQPGSSIKPIGPYSQAIEYDRITWSTIIDDSPLNPEEPASSWYPTNYYNSYRGPMTVTYAISMSVNTVAMKVAKIVTPESIFEFLHDDLHMTSLLDSDGAGNSDINLAPMSLGALTYGVTPLEMAGAYQMFVNGGYYIPPHGYTRVTDSSGRTVLEADATPRRVLSEDTSVIMNKLLQQVTSVGTGTQAKISNMPTGGKTGTTDKDVDQWFVGFTPYYVCQVWLGYDQPKTYDSNGNYVTNSVSYSGYSYPPPILFHDLMEPIHDGTVTGTPLEAKAFLESDQVVSLKYCTATGQLATANCPSAVGWYKESFTPGTCSGNHQTEKSESSSASSSAPAAQAAQATQSEE